MSFEGYYQFIGECGHSWAADASEDLRKENNLCPACKKEPRFCALVDVTNGYGEEYGSQAVDAPMKQIGFTDVWQQDHYGNRYATKHDTFEPAGPRWHDIKEK